VVVAEGVVVAGCAYAVPVATPREAIAIAEVATSRRRVI
jgi:hypothetical protein